VKNTTTDFGEIFMTKPIRWYYHRKNCVTCQRSLDFLTDHALPIQEQVNARKERLGAAEALALAKQVREVRIAKGQKVVVVDMRNPPPDDELAALLLGPTGNLRAPAIQQGDRLLIGFHLDDFGPLLASE